MDEIKAELSEIKKELVEIKVDLRHHIKRTDLLEKEVQPVAKFINFITWAAFSTGLIAAILKIRQYLSI